MEVLFLQPLKGEVCLSFMITRVHRFRNSTVTVSWMVSAVPIHRHISDNIISWYWTSLSYRKGCLLHCYPSCSTGGKGHPCWTGYSICYCGSPSKLRFLSVWTQTGI